MSLVVQRSGRIALPSDSAALAPAAPEWGALSTARIPTNTSSPDGVEPGPRPTTLASTSPRAAEVSKADLTACAIRTDSYQDRSDAALAMAASRLARPGSVLFWRAGSQRGAARQSTTRQVLPDPMLTKPALKLTGSPGWNPRTSKSADAIRMPNGRSALSADRSVHISAQIIRFTA